MDLSELEQRMEQMLSAYEEFDRQLSLLLPRYLSSKARISARWLPRREQWRAGHEASFARAALEFELAAVRLTLHEFEWDNQGCRV